MNWQKSGSVRPGLTFCPVRSGPAGPVPTLVQVLWNHYRDGAGTNVQTEILLEQHSV
ncbi:unnamed protein product, partial [Rotaria sp. Silwood1]